MSDNSTAKDNAELCDLLLSEYERAKLNPSNKQKQKQYFSVLFEDIPKKYKTHARSLGYNQFMISNEPYLCRTYEHFLSDMGLEVHTDEITVFGKTSYYLNVYYGNFKHGKYIG